MRVPALDADHLSPEQKILWDRLATGPRGGVRGPYFALLQSPALCEKFEALGRYLRYECAVPHALRELAILLVARRWKAQYEWFAHAPIAAKAGVPAEAIEAIRTGKPAGFPQDDMRVVYEYVEPLLETGVVPPPQFEAAKRLLGLNGVVDLVGLVGQYSTIAQLLNAFEIGIPAGAPLPFAD